MVHCRRIASLGRPYCTGSGVHYVDALYLLVPRIILKLLVHCRAVEFPLLASVPAMTHHKGISQPGAVQHPHRETRRGHGGHFMALF